MNLEKGGRGAIERMVEAYGFKTRQALCDHLGISKSTLATRYMRDSFPAEWVIQCALETGISLEWLTKGHGVKEGSQNMNHMNIEFLRLEDGDLRSVGWKLFDPTIFSKTLVNPILVKEKENLFLCDKSNSDIRDGLWLIEIDQHVSLKEITRLPNQQVKVHSSNGAFECAIEELNFIGQVKFKISSY
ncbi:phage repressor protein CI [Klebsiella sp. R390]|uniref:phage repressor protein CI n=1 Tax=Klebsiella sp. R390 TaxID=2755400 RepID=UPI003DAA141D